MATEIWKPLPGYDGLYEISSSGQVFSLRSSTILKQGRAGKYAKVNVSVGGRPQSLTIHRAMALAFLGPPPEPDMFACHNDGNPANNVIENIRWGKPKENSADREGHGTLYAGESLPQSKLTEADVRDIRRLFAEGMSKISLAQKFGVNRNNIHFIITRQTWKSVE